MDILPTKPQFSLKFAIRLVAYCATAALCFRLYWQTRPAVQAMRLLKTADGWAGRDVQERLAALGPNAVRVLLQELESSDTDLQVTILHELSRFSSRSQQSIPAIINKLKSDDATVRAAAARTLGDIGTGDRAALVALVDLIYDSDATVRTETIFSLWDLAVPAKNKPAHARSRVPFKDDSDPWLRQQLCGALGNLGPQARAGEPWLIDALEDDEMDVRWSAAISLTRVGVTDSRAIAPLLELLRDKQEHRFGTRFRWRIAALLNTLQVDSEELIPLLLSDLRSAEPFVRLQTAKTLRYAFGRIEAAVPALVDLLENDYSEVRQQAAELLGWIGPEARDALPALLWACFDSEEEVSTTAREAIRRIASSGADESDTIAR